MRCATLALAAIVGIAAVVVVRGAEYNSVPNWDAVPTTPSARMQTRTESFGRCICNLSPRCDFNCYCDPDCTAETRDVAFTERKAEVVGTNELVMCGEDNSATEIWFHTQEIERRDPVAKDAVCIVRTNLPKNRSTYWELPSDTSNVEGGPSRPTWPARDTASIAYSYTVGDRLPYLRARVGASGSFEIGVEGSGYLADPRPHGAGGRCTTDQTTGFLQSHADEDCALVGELEDVCLDGLNPAAARYMAIATNFDYSSSANLVPVRHVVLDYATGTELDRVDPSSLFSSLVASAASRRQLATGSTAALSNNNTVCSNAIVKREIVIRYTADASNRARIASAEARYYLATVSRNDNGVYWVTYATTFVYNDATSTADAVPPRVGNPGYIAGRPLLAGRAVTSGSKTAVAARVGGLTLPFGLLCSEKRHIGVRFLHNVQYASCAVNLTQAELRNLCLTTGTDELMREALTPPNRPGQTTTDSSAAYLLDRLGFAGNAVYSNINDWVTIEGMPWPSASPSRPTPTYSAPLKQCSNLLVGLKWTITVARAGLAYNPQDVIVAARVSPVYGIWRAALDRDSNLFNFNFDVSFNRAVGGLKYKNIQPPPILPPMDEDVFFPFRRGDQGTDETY